MDLTQQVKNYQATQREVTSKQERTRKTADIVRHQDALQALSNGLRPLYSATLRALQHEGSRAPRAAPVKTTKPPGYCRNAVGGFYTS